MQYIPRLKEILSGELKAYRSLLELSHVEKEAVIKNELKEIESVVSSQKALLKTLAQLEGQRADIFRSFSEQTGVMVPRLCDLTAQAQESQRDEITLIASAIEDTAAQLKRANILNRELIDTQLKYTSFCINLITDSSGNMDTYANDGRLAAGSAKYSVIDQTV